MPIDFSKCESRIKQIEEKYNKKAENIRSLSQEELRDKIRESLWGGYGIGPDFKHTSKDELINYLINAKILDSRDKDISVATCKCLSETGIDIPEHIETSAQMETYLNEQIRLFGKKK